MLELELLSPAKDKAVGIAAIDCGADAVYIAGPGWGNRKAAGNSIDDIRELCTYAHRFGVRIYLTVNTIIYPDEWPAVHSMMLEAQDAGVDAFIIREERLLSLPDIRVPMHASTQCAIRVRAIREAVSCDLEFFVHGALCVCYSGDCRLSEYLDGRSADRGDCIQACRSLYDLVDESGRTLVRGRALLSMRDFKLLDRLEDLAGAGICSFKIEGRLKSASYVKNVVREYSLALDALVAKHPGEYRRASFGKVSGGFTPNSDLTFNRGYTQWWLDSVRGRWSSMDTANGEFVGEVQAVRPSGGGLMLTLKPAGSGLQLSNGDGFAFFEPGRGVTGFRADRCEGRQIFCKRVDGLRAGVRLYRNINAAFERELESGSPRREIGVDVDVAVSGSFVIELKAETEDGRCVVSRFNADVDKAENRERSEAMLREQLSKRSGVYAFKVRSVSAPGALPLLSAGTINSMRRLLAEDIDSYVGLRPPQNDKGTAVPSGSAAVQADSSAVPSGTSVISSERSEPRNLPAELMRTRYCIKYELGLCPRHQKAKPTGALFLVNNGRRLALGFDCAKCEMTVKAA